MLQWNRVFLLWGALAVGSAGCGDEVMADLCPDDPAKTEAGACGCGVSDADSNGNGVPDCLDAGIDLCPQDPDKTEAGTCGCGVSDGDANLDGVPDCLSADFELCPDNADKTVPVVCGCSVPETDSDRNGVPDCLELGIDFCPTDAAKTLPGVCGCGVVDDDLNGNGLPDCIDADVDLCPEDANKTVPGACGCGVSDVSADANVVPDCIEHRRLGEPTVLVMDAAAQTVRPEAADIDHDGDLDLAVAFESAPAQVYRNDGGTLISIWTENPGGSCGGVSWGDPNGDGWPDLAVAHCVGPSGGGYAHVFMNAAGTLATVPSWTSPVGGWHTGVRWVDWDTDGDDDLILPTLANLGLSTSVYRTTLGVLELAPAWVDPDARRFIQLAVGDISGDDKFDLAFCAAAQAGTSGEGGAYAVTYGVPPAQSFGTNPAGEAKGLALLDRDGDGDLDMVFAVESTLYFHDNLAGAISPSGTEVATSAGVRGQGLAAIDFDLDGDMDLAVGTFAGLEVYENVAGVFRLRWTTADTGGTAWVTVADWNSDGWPDLIASDGLAGVRVYLNEVAP